MDEINQYKKLFGELISIRGVSRLIKSHDILIRGIWLVCLLFSLTILMWQLSLLFGKFLAYPTASRFTEATEKAVFPDISFCNLHPLTELEDEEFSYDMYKRLVIQDMKNNPFNEEWNNRFLFKGSKNLLYDKFFKYFLSTTAYIGNKRKDIPINNAHPLVITECQAYDSNLIKINNFICKDHLYASWNIEFYKCYTLKTNVSNMRGLSLVLYFNNSKTSQISFLVDLLKPKSVGLKFAIHAQDAMPNLIQSANLSPGSETTISISMTKRKRLSAPYNMESCSDSKYINNSFDTYSREGCMGACLQNKVIEECGCFSSYIFNSQKQGYLYPFCGNKSCTLNANGSLTCEKKGYTEIICALNKIFQIYRLTENPCNYCKIPCNESIYDYRMSSVEWPHSSYQMDFFDTYVAPYNTTDMMKKFSGFYNISKNRINLSNADLTYLIERNNEIKNSFMQLNFIIEKTQMFILEDTPFYTWDQMISLVGGCLSLWMGVTVMTAVEFAEYLYQALRILFQKKTSLAPTNVIVA